jgi:hypothetical protein
MPIAKVVTAWSGTTGGPGITQTYFEDLENDTVTNSQAQSAVDAVRAFWDAIKAYLPDEVFLNVSPTVDSYNVQTGALESTATATNTPLQVAGTSALGFAMAAGAKINLTTGDIRNGRRVKGAIFLVPATTALLSTNGLVSSAGRTAINAAGVTMKNAFVTAGCRLIVWSRPLKDANGVITRNGVSNVLVGFDTSEKSAVLRGRRD